MADLFQDDFFGGTAVFQSAVRKTLEERGLMVLPAHEVLQDEEGGPFRCDNCTKANADATRCSDPYIIKTYGGRIRPGKCCDLIIRRGNAS